MNYIAKLLEITSIFLHIVPFRRYINDIRANNADDENFQPRFQLLSDDTRHFTDLGY